MIKFVKNLSKKLNKTLMEDAPEDFIDAFLNSSSFPMRAVSAICFVAVSLALIFSAVFIDRGYRSVFLFPKATAVTGETGDFSRPVTEIRYLKCPEDPSERLSCYTSEILLGSTDYSALPLFTGECRLNECFVRNNQAFVDISPVSPAETLTTSFFLNQCELFEKNVCINFKNIDTIYLYFDGIEVYSEKR